MDLKGFRQHTVSTPYMVGPVHFYTAELGGELVLFDTGPPTMETEQYLRENIDLAALRHIVVTHAHIDHYGQAWWLQENSDAALYLPTRDCMKISQHSRRMDGMYQLLLRCGFDTQYLDGLKKIFDSGVLFPPFPQKFLVAEKDIPAHLGINVLPCPGHSQSDVVYYGEDWAVTGDTLLRGIFQCPLLDLDLEASDRFKNYEAYCTTLTKLAGLEGKKVLPGHRQEIPGIKVTLRFYISKLLLRAQQLQTYKNEENLMVLIDKLLEGRMQDVFHMYLKASEIIFMKDFLRQPELLREALTAIGLFDDVADNYFTAVNN